MKMTFKIDTSILTDFCISNCYEHLSQIFTEQEQAALRISFEKTADRKVILCRNRAIMKSPFADHLRSFLQKAGEHSYIQQTRKFKKVEGKTSRSTTNGTGIRSNVVNISQKAAEALGIEPNQLALIAGSTTLHIVECTICPVPDKCNTDPKINEQEVLLSFHLKNLFKDDTSIFILVPKLMKCTSILVQASQNIKERKISIGQQLYTELERLNPDYLEFRHLATGATMTASLNQIIPDATLASNAIKLTYYQRKVLNVNKSGLSKEINIDPWKKDKIKRVNFDTDLYLKKKIYEDPAEVSRIIYDGSTSKLFCKVPSVIPDPGMEILNEDNECFDIISVNINNRESDGSPAELELLVNHQFSGRTIRFCRETFTDQYYGLQLFPVFTEQSKKRSIKKAITDVAVGKSELELSAVRPYSVDDDRDIIRLSNDNIALLGIEETDRVIIRHKNKAVTATVLAIDSLELMQETNIVSGEADLDIIAGIPNPLRRELDIHDVETEVVVERDTRFLFKKNANIQFLPIVAFLFTILQIWPPKDYGGVLYWIIIAAAFLLCSLLIMYLMLSSARGKVKGSGRTLFRKQN